MKQHVSVEQLEEIEGTRIFKKLEEILGTESRVTDYEYNVASLMDEYLKYLSKELTIGKMIEILYKHKVKVTLKLDLSGNCTDEDMAPMESLCDETWKELIRLLNYETTTKLSVSWKEAIEHYITDSSYQYNDYSFRIEREGKVYKQQRSKMLGYLEVYKDGKLINDDFEGIDTNLFNYGKWYIED